MNKKNWFIYSLFFIFWLFLIGLLLYSPYLMKQKRSINVLTLPSIINAEYLVDFEKKTGIKVNLSHFEYGEELLVKLRATQGKGYDLIMPTDFAVELLRTDNLLKKLDKSKLNFLDQIYPALCGKYFDPNNDYTIPCFWTIYGIGVNTDYWGGKLPPQTWGLLFDKKLVHSCVIMPDGARELMCIAAKYLFGKIDNLTSKQIRQAIQLLKDQKEWVQMYNDLRVEFLLASKVCPVAVASSADIAKMLSQYKNISFIVPKEGSFAWIDSFAIPIGTDKEEFVYQFLNYLYTPEVFQKYIDKYKYFPPIKNVQSVDQLQHLSVPTDQMFEHLDFFRNVIDEHLLSELLIELKA